MERFQAIKEKMQKLKEELERVVEEDPVVTGMCLQLVAEMMEAVAKAETEILGKRQAAEWGDGPVWMNGQPVTPPVACPVPSCTRPGIRSLHRFCQEHYDGLPEEMRRDLDAKRLLATRPPAPVACPVPGCTRPGIHRLHRFCQAHYDMLPEHMRRELRAKQLVATRPRGWRA